MNGSLNRAAGIQIARLAGLPWLRPTAAYLAVTAVFALLTHNAAHPLTFLGARLVSGWFPVAFSLQAILVAAVAATLPREKDTRIVHLVDLGTWMAPLGFMVAVRLGSVDYGPWLTICVLAKLASGLFAVALAVRGRLRDSHAALALAALALICYLLTIPYTRSYWPSTNGVGLTGDEPHYLVVTVSLLKDHDLFIEDELRQPQLYSSFYAADLWPGHTAPARDGHLASFHDYGLSILATVPYAIGGWHLVLAAIALAAALVLREVYLVIRLAGIDPLLGVLATALAGVSLPFVVYANMLFTELVIALPIMFSMRQIWAAQRGARSSPFGAGLALAVLPWVHFRSWPLVIVVVLTGLLIWRGWLQRAVIVAPVLVAGATYAALSSWVFGRLLLTPLQTFAAAHLESLPVDLIAQARPWLDSWDGLLMLTPVLLLGVAGIPLVARMGWAGLGTIVAIAVYSSAIGVFFIFNGEGWAPPGRYMVPVVPLLAIPLAAALERLPQWAMAYVVLPLAAWGVCGAFISLADRRILYSATDSDQHQPATILGSLFGIPVSRLAPTWLHPGIGSFAKVAMVVAVIAVMALWLARSPRRTSGPMAPLATPSPTATGTTAGVAASPTSR